ncbi:Phr family secreted Rap phosphatase inhibitor [Brevibacillus sp. IT-7CA2]
MNNFLSKHKKSVLLIITGGLAIVGTYVGISEEAQIQILKGIEYFLQ